MNAVVLDQDLADAGLIAGLDRGTPHSQHALQVLAIRRELSFFQRQPCFSHRKGRADIDQFGIKGTDQVHASLLGNMGSLALLIVGANHGRAEQHGEQQNWNVTWVHTTPRPGNCLDYSAVQGRKNMLLETLCSQKDRLLGVET